MQRTISWTNPTTYTDNSLIDPIDISKLLIHIYKDSQEVYVTLPGVTTFPIEVVRGETNQWQLQSELNAQKSPLSPPYAYTEPFPVPKAPIVGSII